MQKGANSQHRYTLPLPLDSVKVIRIIYTQGGKKPVFAKTDSDVQIVDGEVVVGISQEESYLFDERKPVYARVRVLTTDGDTFVSEKIPIILYGCSEEFIME